MTPGYPILQELIDRFGGYDKITAEGWAQYDAAVAAWHVEYRKGLPTPPAKRRP